MKSRSNSKGFVLAQVMIMLAMVGLLVVSVSGALDQQMEMTRQMSLRLEALEACRYLQENLWTASVCRQTLSSNPVSPNLGHDPVTVSGIKLTPGQEQGTGVPKFLTLGSAPGSGFRNLSLKVDSALKQQPYLMDWSKTFLFRISGGSAGYCRVMPKQADWNQGVTSLTVECAPNPNWQNPYVSKVLSDFSVSGSANRKVDIVVGATTTQLEFVREYADHGIERIAIYNRSMGDEIVDSIADNAIPVELDIALSYRAGTSLSGSFAHCPVSARAVFDRASKRVINCVDVPDPLVTFCTSNGGKAEKNGQCDGINPRKTDVYCQVAESLGLLNALPVTSGNGATYSATQGRCVR